MSIFFAGVSGPPIQCVGARVIIPYGGCPMVNLDLDPELPITPTGKGAVTIGLNLPFVGTIDDAHSGRFGEKATARLVSGLGWSKSIVRLDVSSPAGVPYQSALATVAAQVLEPPPIEVPPSAPLDPHFVLYDGPASQVFFGRTWWVDHRTGITTVGPRIPVPANPLNVEVMEWDPQNQIATIKSDDILTPGLILVDPRFGTVTIRDVDQTFTSDGSTALCWCAPTPAPPPAGATNRLATALANAARAAVRPELLSAHRYRVVLPAGSDKLVLQAVGLLTDKVPDMLPVDCFYGIPGVSSTPMLGSEVTVVFANGDEKRPQVIGYAPPTGPAGIPIEVSINAVRLAFGLGLEPIALAPEVIAAINSLQSQITAVAQALVAVAGITPLTGTHVTAAGAATAATTGGASTVGAAVAKLASTKVFSE